MNKKIPIAKIEEYIEKAISDWKIPGGAVAIIENGNVLSSRGYGVTTAGGSEKVNNDTLFPIGSCTKAFSAAVLGKLVDEGKVGWDDKVSAHLPDFRMYDPWITEHVTVRDMLCHRTGTMRCIRLLYKDLIFDSDYQLKRIEYLRPVSDFRTQFGYNNPHFIVAGKVAEAAAGASWSELVRTRLFEPLGMNHSYASLNMMRQKESTNISSPHANLDGGFVPAELRVLDAVSEIPWTDYGENSAGSIISNLRDMTSWLLMLLNGGVHSTEQLLYPETVAQLVSPQVIIKPGESEMDPIFAVGLESNFLSYGLGWYVMNYRGYKMVFHPGQVHGFVSAVAFLPELKIGGIVLLNTYNTMLHPMLGFYIFDALLGIQRDYSQEMQGLVRQWREGAENEIGGMLAARPNNPQIVIPIQNCLGKFESPLFGHIEIYLENGQLMHRYGETDLFVGDLELWEQTTYVVNYRNKVNPPDMLTFIPNEDGSVQQIAVKDVDVFHRI